MPFKNVFDPDFKYRTADSTDVRLTFARIRREQRRQEQDKAGAKVVLGIVPVEATVQSQSPFPKADVASSEAQL
jgi:hypothetical protein